MEVLIALTGLRISWTAVKFFALFAVVSLAGSVDPPPSFPAVFNTEHWVPLAHTDQSTFSAGKETPMPPVSDSWQGSEALIFVGLVHYRDHRCTTTLSNLFKKAKYPQRIRVGIVEQIQTEEDSYTCLADYCKENHGSIKRGCPYIDQIKIIQFTHNLARGPNFARYMQESLRENEEFCMQIDAHSDFVQDWDVLQTQMWGAVQNEYAVLSTTPVDVAVLRRSDLNGPTQQVPHLCQAKIDERGMVVSLPPTLAANLPRPILSNLYAAGNTFSKCHAVDKVPADPNLQMIFEADEFSIFARLWTRGYDVYTPNKIVVGHDYDDHMPGADRNNVKGDKVMEWATRRPGQAQFNRYLFERSLERVSTQLGAFDTTKDANTLATLTRYGLGTKRTLEQLIEFTGIDTRKKQVFGDRCEELKWVPFLPDKDPYVDSGDIWGGAPELLPAAGRNNPLARVEGSVTIFPEDAYRNAYVDALAYSTASFEAAVQSSSGAGAGATGVAAGAMEVASADAKYLRAKAGEYAVEAKIILEQDLEELETIVQHRGKELWWLFQPLDTALESAMNRVDREFGPGMGSKVMKVVLLMIPVFAALIYVAQRALRSDTSVEEDVQNVVSMSQQLFRSPSPSSRKHNSSGKQH